MRKTLRRIDRRMGWVWLAAVVLSVACQSCRSWPEATKDVQTLRALHARYRAAAQPRNVSETADFDALDKAIDQAFAKMETLTK